jgi:hypothetical protein
MTRNNEFSRPSSLFSSGSATIARICTPKRACTVVRRTMIETCLIKEIDRREEDAYDSEERENVRTYVALHVDLSVQYEYSRTNVINIVFGIKKRPLLSAEAFSGIGFHDIYISLNMFPSCKKHTRKYISCQP